MATLALLLSFSYSSAIYAQDAEYDTLTIMTYNLLNFSSDDADRVPYFLKIVHEINPDILIAQEMMSKTGSDYFLTTVMNSSEDKYSSATFIEQNQLFYRKSILKCIKTEQIPTDLSDRDFSAFTLKINNHIDTSFQFIIYSTHLKASNTTTNRHRRYLETLELKEHADNNYPGTHYIVAGDFNVYDSNEPAYMVLMDSMAIDLFDPLESPGDWHNESSFAWLYTQATRIDMFPGSGLDDRFDFILMSEPFQILEGLQYIQDSYYAFGNDGKHFNQSINYGENTAISAELADALYYASDHLPVIAKVCYQIELSEIDERITIPENSKLITALPNPFNQSMNIKVAIPMAGSYSFCIFNINGKQVWNKQIFIKKESVFTLLWNAMNLYDRPLTSGIYLINVSGHDFNESTKAILLR